ncbi:MAG TPA: hypothetical protein EYQ75_13315, partial [Planctomycetaceae bacterium]|nr:hypothetical protein [Planctomycetaceae bacterium]
MPKKKTNPNEDPQGDLLYDRMPGADAVKKEDTEGFSVDLNFDTQEGAADEEAETAQEDTPGDEAVVQESQEDADTKEQVEEKIGKTRKQEILIAGMLDKQNLMELLRTFMVYETTGSKRVKKIAKYQQFRAVQKCILQTEIGTSP